jgi:NAD/NADP transhydrogenase beta subunit
MSLRQYLVLMLVSTILCWIAWGLVLINVDPFNTPTSGLLFFYVSLFLGLVGTGSLIAFACYRFFVKTDMPLYRFVQKSFRDGVIIAISTILLLILQAAGLLRWWSLVIFIIFICIIVGFNFSMHNKTTQ